MRLLQIVAFLASALTAWTAEEPLPEWVIVGERDTETATAFALEKEADFVVFCTPDGKLDIGVRDATDMPQEAWIEMQRRWQQGKKPEKVEIDERAPYLTRVLFDLRQLESFFNHQRLKDLIVVIIEKNRFSENDRQTLVFKLRDYFLACGYKRVSVQQALGTGRFQYLDTANPDSAKSFLLEQPANSN